ncbi:hypothetical protein [Cohnella thailandensis]|nr:hypothetical protein [Cohnella thailandensis]MBP1974432.1 hypothetical protein [Cohnella thailandensis]
MNRKPAMRAIAARLWIRPIIAFSSGPAMTRRSSANLIRRQ